MSALTLNIISVATGGAVGSLLRYGSSQLIKILPLSTLFPLATFIVNVLGCFFIGYLSEYLSRKLSYSSELQLLLITGVLGGFTTFSTFGLELVSLLRSGNILIALLYGTTSLLLGISAVYLGIKIAG